jgi:hypothetical protein
MLVSVWINPTDTSTNIYQLICMFPTTTPHNIPGSPLNMPQNFGEKKVCGMKIY